MSIGLTGVCSSHSISPLALLLNDSFKSHLIPLRYNFLALPSPSAAVQPVSESDQHYREDPPALHRAWAGPSRDAIK